MELPFDPQRHWPLFCRSVQSGRRMKWTSPGHKRPSLLSSRSVLPELTSEVLLPYKWDKVFSNCWLKLKPNSHMRWRQFVCMWKEIVMSNSRLTWVSWMRHLQVMKKIILFDVAAIVFVETKCDTQAEMYFIKGSRHFVYPALLNKKITRFDIPTS